MTNSTINIVTSYYCYYIIIIINHHTLNFFGTTIPPEQNEIPQLKEEILLLCRLITKKCDDWIEKLSEQILKK